METITTLVIAKALDGLHARHIATASNIANANTPNYRPLAVSFEASLKAAADKGAEAVSHVRAQTDLAPQREMDGGMRLDLEVATASQTAMRYAALLDMLGRQMAISRTIVSGGR